MRSRLASVFLLLSLVLVGCAGAPTPSAAAKSGLSFAGRVHGGQQPIAGAHVYLFAANTTGYGGPRVAPSPANASLSLLSSATGNADSIGNYVLSGSDGSFSITGDYTCTANQQVYLYAQGGNPGAGINSASGLLAALGSCSSLTPDTYAWINEVSTVAAAYALAGFATDATHVSSSGTSLAQTGIANAFLNSTNLASLTTGTALTTTPSGTGVVPQSTINTLANILAACVNSSGPTSTTCSTLFTNTTSAAGAPTDTASAAIDVAQSPAGNVTNLFTIPTPAAAFAPALSSQPNDFTLGVVFTGGGLSSPTSMAVDEAGNVWVVSEGGIPGEPSGVTELSSTGAFLSGAGGYAAGLFVPGPISIDTVGNVFIGNYSADLAGGGSVVELSSSGQVLSGTDGYTAGGIRSPGGLGVDTSGNIWVANTFTSTITKLSPSGQALSGPSGFSGGGINEPSSLAIDASNNVWIVGQFLGLAKLSSSGTIVSPSGGFTASGFYGGSGLAVDNAGDIWVTIPGGYAQVDKFSPSGVLLSGAGYMGGGIALDGGYQIALDGGGNAWIPLAGVSNVAELSNDGTVLSGPNGYGGGIARFPLAIAIDGSGDVWVSSAVRNRPAPDAFRVTELIGASIPVVTPIASGVKNNSLASRP